MSTVKTKEEKQRMPWEPRPWNEGDWLMLWFIIIGGVLFCTPIFLIVFYMAKITFKINGSDFP